MTALPLLGVDPGTTSGGCAALTPGGVQLTRWLCYVEVQRAYTAGLLWASQDGAGWVPQGELARVLYAWDRPDQYRLAVEGLFAISEPRPVVVSKKGKRYRKGPSPASQQALGLSAGVAIGALLPRAVGPVHRPLAVPDPKTKAPGWRQRQLGLTGAKADAAEAYAVQMAERLISGLPSLEVVTDRLATQHRVTEPQALRAYGALCEAAWIARDLLAVTP